MTNDMVDKQSQKIVAQQQTQSVWASVISVLFHPVFVPIYVIGFLLFVQPYLTYDIAPKAKILVFLQGFINFTFFPIISILLLKKLGLIKSFYLKEQRDRIIPFIICNIWYFWIWYVWRTLDYLAPEFAIYAMSIFIVSALGLLANIYIKISMHMMAAGATLAFFIYLSFNNLINFSVYLSIVILLTGIVASARLALKSHTNKELVVGLLVGFISMGISLLFN